MDDDKFEALAFPHLFPLGRNTLSTGRTVNLTAKKYFIQKILDVDGRFAKNIDYLLAAQYCSEQKHVQDSISIMMRQSCGKVNAGQVKNSSYVASLCHSDNAFRVLKKVRGSPPYWAQLQHDVMAMIRQLGKATFFLILSCADLKWPDVIQIIARQYGRHYTDNDIKEMSFEDKSTWIRTNPVTVARHFHYRLQSFFHNCILTPAQPLGPVEDYVIRIEFQQRGSPHAHIVLWIKDAPQLGVDTDEQVTEFINRYQTASLCEDEDVNELVRTVQTHNHSSYCRKNGTCRFEFPKPPSNKTLIATCKEEGIMEANNVMKSVYQKIHKFGDTVSNITLEEILEMCGISQEEYSAALAVTKKGSKIILQRTTKDLSTNPFNKHILKFWGANMDLQYIVDCYACVMYLASYVLKAEKGMSMLLKNVAKEAEKEHIRIQL